MLRNYLILFLIFSSHQLFAEGTKQLRPLSTDFGYMQVYDNARTFATYNCIEAERLNIHISSNKEKIFFGFGTIWDTDGATVKTDLYYRIKNPSGVVVYSARLTPSSGTGYISTYTKAVNGPTKLNASGYIALSYAPVDTGDYYIEFNPVSATVINKVKRMFTLFDITVIDTVTNVAKPGRLWSKSWDLSTNAAANGFKGTMYVYSNDGVVTSVNFNGIQPWGFTMSCNSTGCENTGFPGLDRQSRSGSHIYPEYKIFLNDPDIKVYPNGTIGTLNSNLSLSGCAPNYCINVTTDAPGNVEFLVDLNGTPGYQAGSKDLLFATNVVSGTACIPWDGKDGLGNLITQNINFEMLAEYKFGLTNLPMYDVENFSGGFIVSSIRPLVIKPNLFWDDSNVGGSTNLIGCSSSSCHPWPSADFGNVNSINTWWYVNVQRDTIVTLSIPKPSPDIIGSSTSCDTTIIQNYSTTNNVGNSFTWKSKRGSILSGINTNAITFRMKTGKDTLTVLEINGQGCYQDTLFLSAYQTPNPSISGDVLACDVNTVDVYTTTSNPLNTYHWTINGGTILSGESSNTVTVKWTTVGNGSITLRETNPLNCFADKIKSVNVLAKPITSNINH